MRLTIATRRSQLALAQSRWVAARLQELHPGLEVKLREYVTRGDRIQNVPLAEVGGKGLFTKEIEDALLNREADLAVHSLKDLPTDLPEGLTLGAIPEREDPRDALVLRDPLTSLSADPLASLSEGAHVGSSSLRRQAQLLHARPDLRISDIRGNVDTRLRKLSEGQYDAIVLAAAGLRRLGLEDCITTVLEPNVMTPAPGQGALGIECRQGDETTKALLLRLDHVAARACVLAERTVLASLGGGCSVPLGAYASLQGDELHLTALLATPDGKRLLRESLTGDASDPAAIGREVADRLFAAGARELLR